MSVLLSILHLTVPHHSNDFRARLLQPLGLFTLLFAFMVIQLFIRSMTQVQPGVLGYAANIAPSEVIRLTNLKRTEEGLAPLQVNSALAQAAEAKGKDMLEDDYWAHIAPDGTQPWDFFAQVGYKYRYAGENLARDFSNPQATVDAWMASPSHRDNLMSPKYTEIGVAVVEGDLNGVDTTLVVQLFGTPMGSVASSNSIPPVAAAETEQEPEEIVTEQTENVQKVDLTNTITTSNYHPVTSPLNVEKLSATVLIGMLSILLIMDVIVLRQKKLPRRGGRPLAHISFFALIFVVIMLAKAGSII